MKPIFLSILLSLLLNSCIPIRIAPTIKEDKIMVAKKFKRKLPKTYSYIFTDPKNAGEFYNYINTKYQRNHFEVDANVPFKIKEKNYYISFRETEIPTKTINLVPMVVDNALEENDHDSLLEDHYFTRKGTWYLVLTVSDDDLKDCLAPDYTDRNSVVSYLKDLRIEYLNTTNYSDVLFKK